MAGFPESRGFFSSVSGAKLVLATANPGKLSELRALLEPLGIEGIAQERWQVESIEETGSTFAENALLKARHAAQRTGLPSLADDSGLEIDALGGRPGVYSARYAGESASDEENNAKVLRELQGIAADQRTARYRCVLALVRSATDPSPLLCEGIWEGRIGEQAAGSNGFGYDPLLLVAAGDQTVAQLESSVKNSVSHRAQALRQLVESLGARR